MKFRHLIGLAAAALLALSAVAIGQTTTLPQVSKIGPTDLFQDVVGGAPQAGNFYASSLLLSGYGGTLPTKGNVLVGGDATTNLFQRATTGASETTTYAYGGPDRWAYWSGTGTAVTLSRDTTAADLPASGYLAGFKFARTSGQTGVIQSCMAQEVESANSYQFQGQTAELDFNATAGANFSAASSNVKAYIITGTGSDEGMQKLAWGLNAGGGGSTAWSGQANATAAVITINPATGRYAAVATIPATATEIGVALCFTPVGTAGTNDYVAFSGIQLVRNASLASSVSATVGYDCTTINCTAFDRRPQAVETLLQQRYYYKLVEVATTFWFVGPCQVSTTSLAVCMMQMPVPLRVAPTMTYTTGFDLTAVEAGTTKVACTTLQTSTVLSGSAPGILTVPISCASSAGFGAAGTAAFLVNGGGSGVIQASAEL